MINLHNSHGKNRENGLFLAWLDLNVPEEYERYEDDENVCQDVNTSVSIIKSFLQKGSARASES